MEGWYWDIDSQTRLDRQLVGQKGRDVMRAGTHQSESVALFMFCLICCCTSHMTCDLRLPHQSHERRIYTHTRADIFFLSWQFFFVCVLCPADEREDVQKKTFTKWVNSQLTKVRYHYFIKSSLWSRAEHFHLAVILTSRHEPGFQLNVKGIFWKVTVKRQRKNAN